MIELYERAIAGARREGCGHEEALAHERCARCLEARGDHEAAEAHFRTAVEGYAAWGALAKVRLIAEQRPSTVEVARSSADATGGARAIKAIDLGFPLRASETLTSELVLDRLLQKLMPICIEAAAAERPCWCWRRRAPSFARWRAPTGRRRSSGRRSPRAPPLRRASSSRCCAPMRRS